MCRSSQNFFLSSFFSSSLSSLTTPTKFVPLSLVIADGVPLLLVNLDNALRKLSVLRPNLQVNGSGSHTSEKT